MVLLNGSFHETSRLLFHNLLDGNKKLVVTISCKDGDAAQRVAQYYQSFGKITKNNIDVTLSSTVQQLSELFVTEFYQCSLNNVKCFSNSCEIEIPESLQEDIVAVLGLNSIPIVRPTNLQQQRPHKQNIATTREILPRELSQFNPQTVASLYDFPIANGQGQKIGIIELGGKYFQSDLNTYFSQNNLPLPAPTVNVVLVDGAQQIDDDASLEVALDVDVIAAVVPRATITLYFAQNSMQGFYRAIQVAGQNNDIVSVSWGLDEASWLNAGGYVSSFQSLFQSLGKTILVSSGDNGSAGDSGFGAHVSFPASVPGCLACGGTTLNATSTTITSETAWSGSGGGYSALYSKPAFQNSAFVSTQGRGIPDLSGVANPSTGFLVRCKSTNYVVGGTSAVAPLFAALFARMNQLSGTKIGIANTLIYNLLGTNAFRDVNSGNNGGFTAVGGWDAVTGLGVPHGTNLYAALYPNTPSTPPTTPSPPVPVIVTISNISPSTCSTAGGTVLTITGLNLDTVTNLTLGSVSVNMVSKTATQITFVSPAQSAGVKTVSLVGGSNTPTTTILYVPRPSITSVSPTTGSRYGNTLMTIRGTNLQTINRVAFGSLSASIVSRSATIITLRTPRMTNSSVVQAVCSFRDSPNISFRYQYI